MASNRELVDRDRERLGLTEKEQRTRFGAMAQEAATAELQQIASEGAEVIRAETGLKQLDIGYTESDDVEGFTFRTYVTFDPAHPPSPIVVVEDPARLKAANEHWARLQVERAKIGRRSPAVFALMEHGGDPAAVAAASPADARKAVGLALGNVLAKIGETETALAKNDLDWRELGAIHAQLFAGGRKGPSGEPWNDPVKRSVARDLVQAYEDRQWWINLGLATAGAAAFLFSELATGGLATILWASAGVGLAGVQAGMAWESYGDLASAAASSANPDQQLVTHEAADAAFTAAVIESVFAFIDAAGGAKMIIRSGARLAGELGAAARARDLVAGRARALAELDTMTAAEAATSVEAAVRELGASEAIRRSGKGADELAELVGRESDTGRRLLGQATVSDASGVLGFLDRLMGEATRREGAETALRQLDQLAPHEAAQAVATALDVLGPQATLRRAGGWERLAGALDETSEAATRLKAWRQGLERDLVAEFGPERVLVTGSGGKLSNDLDVSVLGPNAARDRERVRLWLAARAGGGPDELKKLLHCDVFTDPLRMHPADMAAAGLSDTVREQINRAQAARQEQLLQNHRLYEARAAKNADAEAAIRQEMKATAVDEIPDFRPLTSGERERLGRRIDELHAALVEASKRGDSGEVARLCDEIADRQAMINVSEGGGYFTGGGARRYVTERDKIPGIAAGEASAAQLYGAYLAQLPNLDKAADGLRKALAGKGGPDGLENAMRALGKYGERQNEVAAALVRRPAPHGPAALDDIVAGWFDEVAGECKALLHEVRSGGVRTALGQVEAAKALRTRAGDLLDRMQRLSANLRETLLEHSRAGGVLLDAGPVTSAIRHELLVEQLSAFARFALRVLQEEAEQQVKEQATAPAGRSGETGAAQASAATTAP